MLTFSFSGLGNGSAMLIELETSSKKIVLLSGYSTAMCDALEESNPEYFFITDENSSKLGSLILKEGNKPIPSIKAIRDSFGWSLRKAQFVYNLSTLKGVQSCEPVEFILQAKSFLPAKAEKSTRRILLQAGAMYGVPTYVKLEIKKTQLTDRVLLVTLFNWAQNDEVPWIHLANDTFGILSCSDETCCSLSFGDRVTIYDESLPNSQRTYLCDRGSHWTPCE